MHLLRFLCGHSVAYNVCPNCAGGFVPRPIRPATARRPGTSRLHQSPGDKRRRLKHDMDNIKALVTATKDILPEQR
ncbi:DUF1272 domain-containing protein [Sulfitobacter sp. F26204]|uniref:DUF1272 domain-containing protein n=1 Tax=Sulfitobacter sp. F26204 TaxID=2996014 RepID=UPI00225DEF4C|nr:DUF1272 domain-containing protein [Sulfitobacter sp. F26204]MCX7559084.1 DUF1272 domain-containing protein [Sulfitobacter sp. F26204]